MRVSDVSDSQTRTTLPARQGVRMPLATPDCVTVTMTTRCWRLCWKRRQGMRAEQRRGLAFAMLPHLKRVAMDAQANGEV